MKFDSKVVIPTQFVLFNFTAIMGSAVLYRDFDKLPYERMIIFLYGCAATFLGVFMLATPSANADDDEEGTVQGDVAETPSEAGIGGRPGSIRHRGSFTFSPARDQPLPFPASTPVQAGPSTGSLRGTLRPRASSSGIGLSPAKYLLLATGTTPTPSNSFQPLPAPVLAMPILRQQSTPVQTTPRRESYQTPSRLGVSRGGSRSRSREAGVGREGAEGGETVRTRVHSVE